MGTTHKRSPQGIAQQVIESNRKYLEGDTVTFDEKLETAIMLGIAAYNDADNQRPENLSEACRRLGVNLHWVDRRNLSARFEVYFGLGTPLSVHDTEAAVINQLEELAVLSNVAPVPTWVKAAG